MTGYTKLFSSIVTSTIWSEDDATRIVWITMLAIADRYGEVQGSIPGLARLAGVPAESCRGAITKFLSPDPDSRTKDDAGRRIEEIEGGWHLINHSKYRAMASKEEAAASNAERQRRHREKKKRNGTVTSNADVTENNDIAEADTQTDADADAETKAGPTKKTNPPAAPSLCSIAEFASLFSQPEFTPAWDDFILHRRKVRKPLTDRAARAILTRLTERPQQAIAALNEAVERAWQTVKWEWLDKKEEGGRRGYLTDQEKLDLAREQHRARCCPEKLKAKIIELPPLPE